MACSKPSAYHAFTRKHGFQSLGRELLTHTGYHRNVGVDYAQVLQELSDVHFAEAEKIAQDNLNTHNPASLYQAFTASEARRLVERFEWHYDTPKRDSWLNMAESELAILSNQCLDRRIPDRRSFERQVVAWLRDRNIHNVKADWRFKTADARIKQKCLYPAP